MASSPRSIFLFAGDDLTEGTCGEGYVERVAKALYQGAGGLQGDVINAGQAGDTVASLLKRIDAPLQQYAPHWVILAVGRNDAWMSWLSSHSIGWWLWLRYRRLSFGQTPITDLDQFAASYRALIDRARQINARVLVCTATPVGEKLSSPVNRHLARLNGVIKHVAAECQVPVADVWQAFVEELSTLSRPSSYVAGEWMFTLLDRRRLQSRSPDEIASRRRLHLTFDGVHLNSRGADLWARVVLTALARAQGVAVAQSESPAWQLGIPCFEKGSLRICASPGWGARARDVADTLAEAYECLSSLTGVRPAVQVAVLTQAHWSHVAGVLPYPRPAARWEGRLGVVFMPQAYDERFQRDVHLPEAVALVTSWPPALEGVGASARATALADLLAVQELARLFLQELQVTAADPVLDHLMAACLTQVAIHAREGESAAAMAAGWDTWGEVLARAGDQEGQIRLQARALFEAHGEGVIASIVEQSHAMDENLATSLERLDAGSVPEPVGSSQ
jgi:lysophospholipase L1-like esterase